METFECKVKNMAQQFRTKKTDDGKTVAYPVAGSKKSADGVARTLSKLYPNETIKVLRIGKGKDMFAPFIAYVGKRMGIAFPTERINPEPTEVVQERHIHVKEIPKESKWFSKLPSVTYKALANSITEGGGIYSVINGASMTDKNKLIRGDATIFGSNGDGSVSYVIEWNHISDNPQSIVGVYNDGFEREISEPVEATALRAKIHSKVDSVKSQHKFTVGLQDGEASRVLDMLNKLHYPDEIVGVYCSNDQITVYPINHGNETVIAKVDSRGRNQREQRTFVKASSLRDMLNMYVNSGTPNMILGIREGEPIYGEMVLYPDDPHSYYGKANSKEPPTRAYREQGKMSILVSPADGSETRALTMNSPSGW
jgi:hypothetical protein